VSFALPHRRDSSEDEITFLFAAAAAAAASFLVGRFSPRLTGASFSGALTGGLSVVCWSYGAFVAHEIGWRGLESNDLVEGSDLTVHEWIRAVLVLFGSLATVIGFFLGYMGFLLKHPPWADT
jgi:hypothetical protein